MTRQRQERRLAAILAADMVGYSRLMEIDEAGTIARQKAYRGELIDPTIAGHGGRIVKTTGDGLLVEFTSVVDATECAVEIQRAMAEREAGISEATRIQYRVGINVGDIVVEGDDIFGTGVNVAARLESLAEPGGICVSGIVFEETRNKIALGFEDLGEQTVKNVSRPIQVYRLVVHGPLGMQVEDSRLLDKPAVAVLPFDNLSGDAEQEYFSDGLSEDIITLLSAWRSFPVVARNSTFAFKRRAGDIRAIARELSARYVIEGSVRRYGGRVRVTAQLIDAGSGHHIWAEKFDGTMDDIFAIQDEITLRIVSSVEPQMELAERNRAETKRAANLNAWECFLRARALGYQLTPDSNEEARGLLLQAIELDPGYSDAYAGLSHYYQRSILLETFDDRAKYEKLALEAARQAVALDDGSSLAHFALAGAYIWANQHDLSIAETRTAIELNPSNVHARLALGNRLDIVGNADEGIALLERSLELHPRDPHSHLYFGQLARAHINARHYDRALGCLREALRRNSSYPHTYHLLAICMGHLGRIDEAREAARECEKLHPGFMARRTHWNIYLDEAANRHLTDGLRKAGLVE